MASRTSATNVPDIFTDVQVAVTDTIPLKDRTGDFINDDIYNPFDIMPSVITQEVEYDAKTNRYILIEKIGDEYYRPPTYMTFDEYMEWQSKQQEKEYFNSLAGIKSKKASATGKIDPMDKIDVSKSLVDKMFGGSEVTIKPQGKVDLTFGLVEYNKTTGAQLLGQRAEQWFIPGDFRIDPRLNVDGSIGKKLNLGFNYDSNATFDFDKKIKLDYSADAFNEDDIIKKIEAGNVSLPLKGNLIQGAQSLFGFKTEVQFGHLRLTGILSQQRSKQNNLKIENGASVQEFDITPDQYDENRHFFLSHFHRENYERSLVNLPQVKSSFRVAQIEVWVTNTRTEFQNRTTPIAAMADLAEGDRDKYHNETPMGYEPFTSPDPSLILNDGQFLPDNRLNPLYGDLLEKNSTENINELDKISNALRTYYNMQEKRDFEVFQGRRLNPSEFTFHPQLGFISLNFKLRPNQSLAVSYKYFYTDKCDDVYSVGQLMSEGGQSSEAFDDDQEPVASKVIYTKLLKSSNEQVSIPMWDLMMKNVYNLRTSNLTKDGFTFDIYFEDDANDGSLKKYIPDNSSKEIVPLLNVFNLDTLNRFGDPQSDGVFDFVPGITVIERTGSVVFPVLEPFGSSLKKLGYPDTLIYQELYDTTQAIAQTLFTHKNKFIMRARVENATSGEILLGPGIPVGAERVTAGGKTLIKGVDYEIDYSLGRLQIINPAYLDQGTPINVTYEDSGAFSINTKVMQGLRADYEVSKKLSVGATYLRLSERPFTRKVNLGNDPINNRIFGVDLNYNDELPWLTNAVDKLPFYSTKAPSSINFTAEGAYLKPGHNKNININSEDGGVVSIDDFEGAVSSSLLGTGFQPNTWTYASTPPEISGALDSGLVSGYNRAAINWYAIDQAARGSDSDPHNPYTRQIDTRELFDRQADLGQNRLPVFNVSYYPTERGVYNFDPENGSAFSKGFEKDDENKIIRLRDPKTRWGGIMRGFQNTDFETANYEFIEFWVLNPFMDGSGGEDQLTGEEGDMVFQLGNISEDIIKDNLQFYENGIPADPTTSSVPVRNTPWGKVALKIPVVDGFDQETINEQDLGLDGMTDDEEKEKYAEWLSGIPTVYQDYWQDPSGDNYKFYGDTEVVEQNPTLLGRFKKFNNPQGNAPGNSQNTSSFTRGNPKPDKEDLNGNRALDLAESFFEYRIKMRNSNGEIDTINSPYYRETREVTRQGANGAVTEKWYRFQVPLNKPTSSYGNITNFRSIQFMRMHLTNFEKAKTFRMADFQLVRSLWRKSRPTCRGADVTIPEFSIDKVGLQENFSRRPFNYRSPKGIQQESIQGTVNNILQDEKSLVVKYENLGNNCEIGVHKLSRLNLTQYKKLQLFIHGEDDPMSPNKAEYGDLAVFVRVGKDLTNNYYEYELPLMMSDPDDYNVASNIWLDTNFIDVKLSKFLDVKKAKLANTGEVIEGGVIQIDDPDLVGAKIRIKGVPSLGLVKIIEVGVRHKRDDKKLYNGQIWINELRCTGLNEKGGYAAQARMQVKMADLGEVNMAANYSSVGFGALDQKLQDRSQEEVIQYDIATTMQLGKLLPKAVKLNLPFFAQYSKTITTPKYDAYQLDLTTQEVLDHSHDSLHQDIKDRSKIVNTIKSVNFTNAKLDVGSGKMPWDPKNISATYSWTESESSTPILSSEKETETKIGLDYRYSIKAPYIQPLKFIKSKYFKFLSEFNFNLVPNTFSFKSEVNRYKNIKVFRLPESGIFQFDDQRYKWDRAYNLDWDLAKSLRFTYKAQTSSIIDELRQVGIAETVEQRPYVDPFGNKTHIVDGVEVPYTEGDVDNYRRESFREFGRSKFYQQDVALSYRVPFKNFPFLHWVSTTADYKAQYSWNGGSLREFDNGEPIGNVIQNNQVRSVNTTFSFDKIYKKSKYLKKIENGNRKSRGRSSRKSRNKKDVVSKDANRKKKADKKDKRKQDRNVTMTERVLIRPLLSLRSVKLSYREDFGTIIPGFQREADLFGMNDFTAPGWDFALGIQPNLNHNDQNNWLYKNQEWFNSSSQFNEQISQTEQQTLSAKIKLEPVKDFDIDIEFSKNYRKDHTEIFKVVSKDSGEDFMQTALYDIGSFEVTHMGLNTLFRDNEALLSEFKFNKIIVSNRLQNPSNGSHPSSELYAEGYGPSSYAVNVPAFMAAYTGQSANSVSLNIEDQVSKLNYIPKPNWQIRYDGLSKIKSLKKIFKSVQLKHGYKSTIKVARFNSNIEYDQDNPFGKKSPNDNYYTELEIPAMSITEQFNPIIGVSVKMNNDLKLKADWKKSRTLNLDLASQNLNEDLSNEFVFGFGYIIKDFKGFSRKKKRGRRAKKKDKKGDKEEKEEKANKNLMDIAKGSILKNDKGRTLTINLDVSFRDNVSNNYRLAEASGEPEPTRGSKTLSIEPSLEYQLYKNLAIRWFGKYNTNQPANTSNPGRINFATGLTASFSFN